MTSRFKVKIRTDFMALVAQKTIIKKRGLLKADLFRLRMVIGHGLKAGLTERGDFILYSSDLATWRKLVNLLPLFTDFREQRIDETRTKIEQIDFEDVDKLLFT